jgi:Coenzyme PQQ synthesis protein D (PqqD).
MKYKLRNGVFLHEEENKKFAINTGSNSIFELNEVANIIFENIEKEMEVDMIFEVLNQTFPEALAKDLKEDLKTFTEYLQSEEFIEML